MDVDVKVVAGAAGVLTDEALLVCLLDGALEDGGFVVEFATDVNVCGSAVHGTTSDQTSLDQLVWVLAHNLTVLAGSGLTLVSVDDEVAGLGVLVPVLEVHERLCVANQRCFCVLCLVLFMSGGAYPFHAGGETSTATTSEAGCLDF